jgi:hypothetical protein
MLHLYVLDGETEQIVPAFVTAATASDFEQTAHWQTDWTSQYAKQLPNRVALRRRDNQELLGLMSYLVDEYGLAVEILYLESAAHSNGNLVHLYGARKRYIGIAKALFAYAANVSMEKGFDGVLLFKAKTSELVDYYRREFGACSVGAYDPFRLVIWDDAARRLLAEYENEV